MKTLLVLRHAKSSWNDTALDDHERPLNKRGRRDGPRMGDLVREHRLTPDVIISSDAVRARLTAEAVAEQVLRLLHREEAAAMRQGLAEVRTKLGAGGASRRAAEEVLALAAGNRAFTEVN